MDFLLKLTNQQIVDLIIAIGIIAAFYLFSPLFSYVIVKIFNFKEKGKKITKHPFFLPLKSFFRILGIYIAILYLRPIFNFNDEAMKWVEKIFRILVILGFSRGFAQSLSTKSPRIKKFKERTERDIDDTSILFTIRIARVIIYIIAAFMIIADLGYDLSGIITGLGLGSVVITFAAQDTIKNFFGGLIIFLDKPFKVGDYIVFNGYEGTVEDITFRSTKLRTLDNTIAQIPNSELSSTTVENISKIQKRRYILDLSVVLDTNLNNMKKLENEITDFLYNDEIVLKDIIRVTFKEVRSSDYNIYINCYLNVIAFDDFLKEKERINYAIMNILQKNHIEMAYNTQTIEIKK